MESNGLQSKAIMKHLDHVKLVAEELQLNGYSVNVIGSIIEYDTIAGKMIYKCGEKSVMADYYRFISHFGSKLHSWGLKMKIQSNV